MGNVKILKASAGSGKTYRLVRDYIAAVIDNPAAYRHTLAVTFTNRATAEMKERIVRQLHILSSKEDSQYLGWLMDTTGKDEEYIRKQAKKALHNILHDYSRFAVVTIDKFFQGIIRSFLRELGISLDFSIELRTSTLLEAAADALVERTASDPDLGEWVAGFVEEQTESGKNWDIRRKLVKAGEEIFGEEWGVDPGPEGAHRQTREKLSAVMKAAASAKAAIFGRMQALGTEAMGIIDEAGLSPEDFHQSRSGVGVFFSRIAAGDIHQYNSYVAKALQGDDGWYSQKSWCRAQIEAVMPSLKPLLEGIAGLWNDNHRAFYSASALEKRYHTFGLLGELASELSRLCSERNVMPIARTNKIIAELVKGNSAPFIFEKAGNVYSRFLIDEFQDTSRMQWGNFVPLLQNAIAQQAAEPVMLVGDVKQSIYRWRGGDWRILAAGAAGALGGADEEELSTNYRSLPEVVRFNNALVERCVASDAEYLKGLLSKAAEGGYISRKHADYLSAVLPAAYDGHAQQAPEDKAGGYITFTVRPGPASDDDPRPDEVVERVEELQRRGFAPSDIAILVRTGDEAQRVARMMLARKAACPDSPYVYDVVTAEALYIGSSPAVEFLAACLRLVADAADDVSRAVWNRHAGAAPGDALPAGEAGFIAGLAAVPPQECFRRLLMRYQGMMGEGQTAYVQAFEEQIVRFCNTGVADLQLFLEWWDEQGATQSVYMPGGGSAVSIITIHASKGLEFKAVILPYCSWDLAPRAGTLLKGDASQEPFASLENLTLGYAAELGQSHFAAGYYDELVMSHVDNINLLYVAVTRAREELHIYLTRRMDRKPAKEVKFVNVGDLLSDAADMSGAVMAGIQGVAVECPEGSASIAFGEPVKPVAGASAERGSVEVGYPTRDPGMRIRMRLPSQRYLDEGQAPPSLTPRSYGVMMHRVFENARTRADIDAALAALADDGALSLSERTGVAQMIGAALEDPVVASWFDEGWEVVRNENDIILPGGGAGTRRPDRVMLRDGRAVVVDYKFGERQEPKYRGQIAAYKDLLLKMGYNPVEGYIWYVSQGTVEEVK